MFSAPRHIRRTAPLVRPVRLTLIAGTAVLGATLTACSGASASGSDKGAAGVAPAHDTKISVNLQGTRATPGSR